MSPHKVEPALACSSVFLSFFLLLPAQAADVVKVISKSAERKIQLPGEFQPYQQVAIYAKVSGFVDKVNVDVGSMVKTGDLLATLVAPELAAQRLEATAKVRAAESQRAEARAKVAAAESTYERLKAASATPGAIAGNELIQAEQQVAAAQAQVRAAEGSIQAVEASVAAFKDMEDYLKVTAPFDGVITERNVHPGALVGGAGKAMFQLEQTTRLRLIVSVPEIDVGGIVKGARVPFTVPAYPGDHFTGTIARVSHSMDEKTRSMAVELDVMNPQSHLAPGMYPAVTWPVRSPKASLLVPPASIVTTTERTFVIRVRDGKAEWVNVSKGTPAGELVEVFGALKPGDAILKRASDEIREGTEVK
jgi:membrane fusion protein (multidrug efflux system)